jgi:invasion protein IalB
MVLEIRDDRQMRALTGVTQAQFAQLLPTFSEVYQAKRQADYEQAVQSGRRQRQPAGDARVNCRRWQINCSLSSTITRLDF